MALLKNIVNINTDYLDYPFCVPSFRSFKELNLNSDAIVLVGDNGSGKSTLLEIIASKLKLYRISEDSSYKDVEFIEINKALKYFDLSYQVKPKGFFFRSEDFITYTKFIDNKRNESLKEIKLIEDEYKNKSNLSKSLAKMPHLRTIGEIDSMYEGTLHKQSHGEAYLDFFKSRLRKNSLYLLDEAEMPLSFNNQLVLLILISDAIKMGCQFIIATHSPVLMAYPDALIYNVSEKGFLETSYEDIEAVDLMKGFLNNKDRYIGHLFK